eukprot:727687-Rhodomonas_salina.1
MHLAETFPTSAPDERKGMSWRGAAKTRCYLVGVEDEVELAHVFKHVVKALHEHVDQVQDACAEATAGSERVWESVTREHGRELCSGTATTAEERRRGDNQVQIPSRRRRK